MVQDEFTLPSVVVSQAALEQSVIGAFNVLSNGKKHGINESHIRKFVNIMYDQAFSEKPDDQRKALKELIDEILG